MKPDILLNILIIDDHPSIIDGYISNLSASSAFKFNFTIAYSCEEAFNSITNTKKHPSFDVVFLDINMPAFEGQKINSGEDLALLVRKHHPESKIIILTSHTGAFILYDIIKKLNPEGVLIKGDFNGQGLCYALDLILNETTYRSETIQKHIQNLLLKDVFLDSINRKIVLLIAQRIQTKNLSNYLSLSSSSIERRKALIKEALDIPEGNDEDIIIQTTKLGFI